MKRSAEMMAPLGNNSEKETEPKKCKQAPDRTEKEVTAQASPRRPALITKLVSGGQMGADLAALKAAEQLGIETGGWAPRDFMTTQGKTPELGTRFGLRELTEYGGVALKASCSATQCLILRSQRNVDDSDGTLVFRLKSSPGTEKTIGYCQTQRWCYVNHKHIKERQIASPPEAYRPYLVITSLGDCQNVTAIRDFIRLHDIKILNVAGHRDEAVEGFSRSITALLCEALTVRV